jgi:hypothetical protein
MTITNLLFSLKNATFQSRFLVFNNPNGSVTRRKMIQKNFLK